MAMEKKVASKNSCFLLLLFFLFSFLPKLSSTPLFPREALPTKSGYLPVNSTSNSAIFYTYYEAQTPISPLPETPILIWLQGGPGCSSMIGNLFELGPWRVVSSLRQNVEHLAVEPNSGSWNRIFGLLFLDSPIGTGFSIAATPDEIPRNQHAVAKHLFAAIKGFISSSTPNFKNRPIYITGESYAGKYVPAIGYYILKKMKNSNPQLNLRGVAIGDGLTDPIIQVSTHAVNAYFSGLINENQKHELEKTQSEAVRFVKSSNWSEATRARTKVLNLLKNMTGLATLYDYTKQKPYQTDPAVRFLNIAEVKRALGVNESMVFEECSDLVGDVLHDDVMKSVKYMVEFLLENTKVLLYQGQYDLRDGVVSSVAWMKTMKWEGIAGFMAAEKKVWRVGGEEEVAGYVQKWENLSHVVVVGAGHLLPADKPLNAQVMIENWVLDKELFGGESKLDMSSKFKGSM